ncbi:hypothetical protein MMIN_29150 [Mycolicibacter minnesotensis]|nr:hypothetical protein MMIN_29150 [Mycolicibacter minnesotensis]
MTNAIPSPKDVPLPVSATAGAWGLAADANGGPAMTLAAATLATSGRQE